MRLISIVAILIIYATAVQAQNLPEFTFANAKNEKITPASLPQNLPIIIFYFDPYADKCEVQAATIKEKAASFKNISLIFVSWAEHDANEAFYKKYLSDIPNVFVCQDDTFQLDTWFGYSELPTIYVYNKNRQKTATFTTVVTVDELLNACNKVP